MRHELEDVARHSLHMAKLGMSLILSTLTSYESLYFNYCQLQKEDPLIRAKGTKVQ